MEAVRALGGATGHCVYKQLFSAAERLGLKLRPQIDELLQQLGDVTVADDASTQLLSREQSIKGVAQNRFDGSSVVIQGHSSSRLASVAGNCQELQLPAVRALTDKFSSQHLLLRTLQSIIRMRDTMKQRRATSTRGSILLQQAADMQQQQQLNPDATQSQLADANAIIESSALIEPQRTEHDDIDSLEKTPLSQLLTSLEPLWTALSNCLSRLSDASDPHAVLALQPAAEAFFLVHASESKKTIEVSSFAQIFGSFLLYCNLFF